MERRPSLRNPGWARQLVTLLWLVALGGVALAGTPTTWPAPDTDAALADRLTHWPRHGVVLMGEQHDADAHQQLQQRVVRALADAGRLQALVLEMADQGRDTRRLPADASQTDVQSALGWNDRGWPWRRYGPVVMEAVRAGVPVLGGNLPRANMTQALHDTRWDSFLDPGAWQALQQRIDEGHCALLPQDRLPGMARIHVARDAAMATTAASVLAPQGLVLLVAGQVHVDRQHGVPKHLRDADPGAATHTVLLQAGAANTGVDADERWITPALPAVDHCAALRRSRQSR